MHTYIKYSKHVTKSAPYTRSSDTIVGFRGIIRSGITVNITIKSETQTQDPCIILGRLWRTESNLLYSFTFTNSTEILACCMLQKDAGSSSSHHTVFYVCVSKVIHTNVRPSNDQGSSVLADKNSLYLSLSSLSKMELLELFLKTKIAFYPKNNTSLCIYRDRDNGLLNPKNRTGLHQDS